MTPYSQVSSQRQNPWLRTIRPYGAYALHGIVFVDKRLIALDTVRGHLLEINLVSDNTTILNPFQTSDFIGATGLAVWENTLWFTRDEDVYFCAEAISGLANSTLKPELFATLPYPVNGVAVWESAVYVTCQKAGYIFIFNRNTGEQITKFYAPGVGIENLLIRDEEIWVSDSIEQTVYCLDRGTGSILFSALTPFEHPTGLAFYPHPETGEDILYVTYAGEEPYIRDDPNSPNPHQLAFRDRTLIHPLHFHHDPANHFTLSNGYLIEMAYVEEIAPLEEVNLENLEWRIALPAESHRQKVRHIEAVGLPFTEEVEEGQRFAVFKFDLLQSTERRLFGWKALVEVRGIKYNLTPRDLEDLPPLSKEFQERYLVDNDQLAMDTEIVTRAAREAVARETNLLRKVLSIRDYVYDQLDYGIKPQIDTPDIVLERGVGSCGEYVGVLLALLRLNQIACRTVGRYKCPPHPDRQGMPLQPDFNHVWLEFYIPGFGWVPMESNPDDLENGSLHPMRFFMGLAWYHLELSKGTRFETLRMNGLPVSKEAVSLGELAINHVRFTILEELPPMRLTNPSLSEI